MHPDNDLYGHAGILRRAAGVADDRPLRAHLQHGWALGSGLNAPYRLVRSVPRRVWSSHNLVEARRLGIDRTEAIGAPFCYLAADRPAAAADLGTIAYPHHGWKREAVRGSHAALARELVEREGVGMTVCLFHVEHDDPEVVRAYEDAGARVVTHGRPDDPGFLERQRAELARHRRAVTNRVGSAIWYAGHLGLEVAVYGAEFEVQETSEEAAAFGRIQRATWPELFADGLRGDDARRIAGLELGADRVRSPEELVELLGLGDGHERGRRFQRSVVQRGVVHLEHRARAALARPRERLRPAPVPYADPALSPPASARTR